MATPIQLEIDNLPIVSLFGRVNVGKSSLFNRLIEENKAIVSSIAGTTRTNNEGIITWRGKTARLIDTGGLTLDENTLFEVDVEKQVKKALEESEVIIFVVDGSLNLSPIERQLVKKVRALGKPLILAINKIDNDRLANEAEERGFLGLGIKDQAQISAVSGRGTGDLLDLIYEKLNKTAVRPKKDRTKEVDLSICLIGKPNVGKSSLFNSIIGEDKVIVSPIAHTTREPFDTLAHYEEETGEKKLFRFVDTAGLRRKSKVTGELERAGIDKTVKAMRDSDLVLFVIDATEPFTSQDRQLGGLIEHRAKSVIIIVNKLDMFEETGDDVRKKLTDRVRGEFPHLSFAPIIFVSAKTGWRVHQIFPHITKVAVARSVEIGVAALEVFLKRVTKEHAPSRGKGVRQPKLLSMRQIGSAPPVFEIFIKYRTSLHRSYLHFLENRLREQFDFYGTPIILKLTKMKM